MLALAANTHRPALSRRAQRHFKLVQRRIQLRQIKLDRIPNQWRDRSIIIIVGKEVSKADGINPRPVGHKSGQIYFGGQITKRLTQRNKGPLSGKARAFIFRKSGSTHVTNPNSDAGDVPARGGDNDIWRPLALHRLKGRREIRCDAGAKFGRVL
mgnify:CR=1 FL=1